MNRTTALPFAAVFLLVTVSGCGTGPREPAIDMDAVLSLTMDSLMEMDMAAPREEGRLSVDGTTMIEPDESETTRLTWRPTTTTELDLDGMHTLMKLVDALEDDDDVQSVTTNFEASEEVMAQL